jgi:L-fucose isomerase-like protein
MVPFGYPDYPESELQRWIDQSAESLRGMGLHVSASPSVIVPEHVPQAVKALRELDYDLIIALLVSWVEAPLFVSTLRQFYGRPLLLWSHTTYMEGDDRVTLGALPAAGVLRETLDEMEAPFRFVYGMPGEPGLRDRILPYARAAAVARALDGARIGLFGYASMGMYTGTIDHTQLRAQVGPEIEHLDQYLIVKRYEETSPQDAQALLGRANGWQCSSSVSTDDLEMVLRMYLAIKSLATEYRLEALTVKCQYELSRVFGLAPCLPLSILGDEMVSSCEGDLPLVVSQLILHYLTGDPTSYGDLHHVTEREILLGACGFAPLSYAAGQPVINKHTALYEGLLNSSPYKEGPVTLARLAARSGGFKMHIAGGQAVPPPSFHEVGCPPYGTISVVLDGDTEAFMQNLFSQHYAIAYGDVRAELVELCRLLDISVVGELQ